MSVYIRPMIEEDRLSIVKMMTVFYNSSAVHTNGSPEIFEQDISACVGNSPYLEGYVFEESGKICGYAMLAKSFSTEFGKPCIWVEDIYILEAHRGKGIAEQFFEYIEERYTNVLFRLEVEEENTHAVHVYKKRGYTVLPYMEMKKE